MLLTSSGRMRRHLLGSVTGGAVDPVLDFAADRAGCLAREARAAFNRFSVSEWQKATGAVPVGAA